MNYVEIDGKAYDVLVSKIQRSPQILQSENAGMTLAPGLEERLDPLGTKISYNVTFKRRSGYEAVFDELWDTLIKPRYDGIPVKIVYNQQTIDFIAKFEVSSQNISRIDRKQNKVFWDEINANIIPMKAQVLPE